MSNYFAHKNSLLYNRYLNLDMIENALKPSLNGVKREVIGYSEANRPIYSLEWGEGPIKILMWSQMHGNESTTTKAVFDLLNYLNSIKNDDTNVIYKCNIVIIPLLNPDGAQVYTRINGNKIDLNRDAQNLSQAESKVLAKVFTEFKPHYCFNLHGQRTIFNVGKTNVPASVSFLAPAFNKEREVNAPRLAAMQIIAAMNATLQQKIPNGVGRYDDGFNANCVGDAFMMTGTPTILFEAGHYPNDYERETVRELIFSSLLAGINAIANESYKDYLIEDYLAIPENGKLFFDVLVNDAHLINSQLFNKGDQVGILYKEVLVEDKIEFVPYIDKTGGLENYFGHVEYNLNKVDDMEKFKLNYSLMDLFSDQNS